MRYMNQYRQLQQFTSLKEFDRHRSKLFYSVKDKLSKGALSVWNTLAQHSCDVPGVSWLKIDTIAKLADVSRSTVERAIRLFKKLGIIRVEETSRPKQGGDGANVYIFQNLGEGAEMTGRPSAEKPCDSKHQPDDSGHKTKTSKANKIHTKERTKVRPSWIPQEFFRLVASHIHSVREIEEYWRNVHAFTYRMNLPQQTKEDIAIEAFMQMKAKRQRLRNPIGYFTGVMKRKAKQRYVAGLFDDVFSVN